MSWNSRHYEMDDEGFESEEEANRAADNGDLSRLSNGNFHDPETGKDYWWDGKEK